MQKERRKKRFVLLEFRFSRRGRSFFFFFFSIADDPFTLPFFFFCLARSLRLACLRCSFAREARGSLLNLQRPQRKGEEAHAGARTQGARLIFLKRERKRSSSSSADFFFDARSLGPRCCGAVSAEPLVRVSSFLPFCERELACALSDMVKSWSDKGKKKRPLLWRRRKKKKGSISFFRCCRRRVARPAIDALPSSFLSLLFLLSSTHGRTGFPALAPARSMQNLTSRTRALTRPIPIDPPPPPPEKKTKKTIPAPLRRSPRPRPRPLCRRRPRPSLPPLLQLQPPARPPPPRPRRSAPASAASRTRTASSRTCTSRATPSSR